LGVGLTPQEAVAFSVHFDANQDGRLSFGEFKEVLAAVAVKIGAGARKRVTSIKELLVASRLSHFVLALDQAGLLSFKALTKAEDALLQTVGMKRLHVVKLRRALAAHGLSRREPIYETADGLLRGAPGLVVRYDSRLRELEDVVEKVRALRTAGRLPAEAPRKLKKVPRAEYTCAAASAVAKVVSFVRADPGTNAAAIARVFLEYDLEYDLERDGDGNEKEGGEAKEEEEAKEEKKKKKKEEEEEEARLRREERVLDPFGNEAYLGLPLGRVVEAFEKLGIGFTQIEARAFHERFDSNHDGRLSFDEFKACLRSAKAEAARPPALRTALEKLFNFVRRRPLENPQRLAALFVRHEMAHETATGATDSSPAAPGLSIEAFLLELYALGVDLGETEAEALFRHLDANQDGLVSFQELKECLRAAPKNLLKLCPMPKSEAELVSDAVAKLRHFLRLNPEENPKELARVFVTHEMAQEEQGGSDPGVSIEALVSEFADLGVGLTPQEAAAFLVHFDANQDGRLSFGEFKEVLAKALKPPVP